MKISDIISMCLNSLVRRKVRTMLTIVGVVVGTCAIMVMVSLGLGMKANQEAMLAQMGDLTVIQVYNYDTTSKNKVVMDDKAVAAMAALPGVDVATPFWQPGDVTMNLVAGNNNRYSLTMNVVGVYPEAMEKFGYVIKEGRFLTKDDKPFTVLMGQNAAYGFVDTKRTRNNQIFAEADPVTGKIPKPYVDIWKAKMTLRTVMQDEKQKPLERPVKVVGTIKQDWSKGYETDQGVFMDINDLKQLIKDYNKANNVRTTVNTKKKGYSDVRVRVKDISLVAGVEQQIKNMGFQTYSMESIRKPMEKQAKQQQLILGGLGFISLFVAALGITNTMVMSIYERTREIGVMKVLGCRLGNIRTVFLIEAGLIGLIGGIVGVGISYGISAALNYFSAAGMMSTSGDEGMMSMMMGGMGSVGGGKISVIPLWLVGLSLLFSTCIGLISGFSPANRAVKISALEAIKHE